MNAGPRVAVAIPAHDEAALIGRCLDALAGQVGAGPFAVRVFANNCTDATAAVARQPRAGLRVTVLEGDLAPEARGAGFARRVAVAAAARDADIVLTTDADCVPDPDWIAAHLAAFAVGVDAVAGRVSGDWAELRKLPPAALEAGAVEWEYLAVLARAEATFAPVPHDPWPRHAQCCGANLGITHAMLERVGGIPALACGEDRALIAAVQQAGGKVRFAPAPHVTASARIAGRAAGGMAAALTARCAPGYRCDAQFQRAARLMALWSDGHSIWTAPPPPPEELLRPEELARETARLRALVDAHG
jgi:cellulose synthase/poly-beta-1,6-N-acetylglucosamine synthase-like glycosyltransferase